MFLCFFLSSTTFTPTTASVDRLMTSVAQSTFSKVENYNTSATPPGTTTIYNDQLMDILVSIFISVLTLIAVMAVVYCWRKRKYILSNVLLNSDIVEIWVFYPYWFNTIVLFFHGFHACWSYLSLKLKCAFLTTHRTLSAFLFINSKHFN